MYLEALKRCVRGGFGKELELYLNAIPREAFNKAELKDAMVVCINEEVPLALIKKCRQAGMVIGPWSKEVIRSSQPR